MRLDSEQEGTMCSAVKMRSSFSVFLHPCHDACAVSSEVELLRRRTNESRAGLNAMVSPEWLRAFTRLM